MGTWTATAVNAGTSVTSLPKGMEITATFDEDGKISGSSGCNTYSGTYEVEAQRLTISEVGGTEKACTSPPGVMDIEQRFLASLPTTATHVVEGTTLSLIDESDAIVALFTRKSQ